MTPERTPWGKRDDLPAPRTRLPTNSRLYPAGASLPGQRQPAPAQPPARKRKTGFILASILALVVVFAAGVGVGAILFKPTNKQAASASATATPVETVILNDPLTSALHPWPVDAAHCRFQGGAYHVLRDFICGAPVGVQSDVAILVQVKQISGTAGLFYGLSFRLTDSKDFYDFRINSNSLWLFDKVANGTETALTPNTANRAIQPGLNVVNTILVRVKGVHFDFFVNGVKVGEANDATFSAGIIGLIGADNADVAFSNFQAATLR